MLFINPNPRRYAKFPQLGLLYLAAVLEKSKQKASVVDVFYPSNYENSLQYIKIEPKEPIGIYVNISNLNFAIQITNYLKNKYPDNPIIWGGPIPSAGKFDRRVAEMVLSHADYGFIGEAEMAIKKIAEGYNLDNLSGIYYKKNGQYIFNPLPPLIENLDELPFPAWHLINFKSYIAPTRLPFATVVTSRGCPRKCIYCTHAVHGYKLRLRSSLNVIDELEYLWKAHGVKHVNFFDDFFTHYPERVKEICELIIKRGLHNFMRFALPNGISADTEDEEMFDLMKKAGFDYISISVESGVQDIVNKLGKNLNLKKVNSTVQKIRKKGIIVGLYFMFGLPFDTEESLKKTIKFAKTIKAEHLFAFLCLPFPVTKLFEIVEQNGNFLLNPYLGYPGYEGGKIVLKLNF